MLPLAAAIELIHTYSLIHDDLPAMDDDELRRGRPTCHVRFGEDVAILAGDGLYAEAFRLLLGEQAGEPASVLPPRASWPPRPAWTGWSAASTSTSQDSAAGRRDGPAPPARAEDRAADRCERRMRAACSPGSTTQRLERYRAFARELGLLFQIVDDILDVTGTDADLGKPSGSDERHGKRTYVSEFGLGGGTRTGASLPSEGARVAGARRAGRRAASWSRSRTSSPSARAETPGPRRTYTGTT